MSTHASPQSTPRPNASTGSSFTRFAIENTGDLTVQLQTRHWIITDGDGHVEEVRGPGVVGEQPVLMPGESFEYTSGCPLTTPLGSMAGTYQMASPTGETFDVEIGKFDLRGPYTVH